MHLASLLTKAVLNKSKRSIIRPVSTASFHCFKVSPHPFFPNVFKKRSENHTWVPSRENCYSNENLVFNVKCSTCVYFHNDGYMSLPFSSFPL